LLVQVTITDYPAPAILQTLSENVNKNIPPALKPKVTVEPHKWGDLSTPFAISKRGHYTQILAADTLWMSMQHTNLAQSMLHFLSPTPEARIFVIAGFHTGRARMAPFFEETVEEEGLEVEEIFEMDANGRRREWKPDAPEELIGERKKWLAVARIKRR
jgi:nicotinamide N-methyltransferase